MIVGVADTHAAIWHIFSDARLSPRARAFIDLAATRGDKIAVSSVSLAEVVYLVEKRRIPANVYDALKFVMAAADSVFTEVAFTVETVEAMRSIPRDAVPDMPDRMIAATAALLRVPVLSRDGRLRAAQLDTLW